MQVPIITPYIHKKLKAAHVRRAKLTIDRQLIYQRQKAGSIDTQKAARIDQYCTSQAHSLKSYLRSFREFSKTDRILEVGSGAHGHIFFMGLPDAIGVDPLADKYQKLFPHWQPRASTLVAYGEQLPFEDAYFDVVISDNVVDHAEDPQQIINEMVRVLAPGGAALLHGACASQVVWIGVTHLVIRICITLASQARAFCRPYCAFWSR